MELLSTGEDRFYTAKDCLIKFKVSNLERENLITKEMGLSKRMMR